MNTHQTIRGYSKCQTCAAWIRSDMTYGLDGLRRCSMCGTVFVSAREQPVSNDATASSCATVPFKEQIP